MRRGNRGQATNTGLMTLLLMLGNQVRQMDQKPPVTIALVVGKLGSVWLVGCSAPSQGIWREFCIRLMLELSAKCMLHCSAGIIVCGPTRYCQSDTTHQQSLLAPLPDP